MSMGALTIFTIVSVLTFSHIRAMLLSGGGAQTLYAEFILGNDCTPPLSILLLVFFAME